MRQFGTPAWLRRFSTIALMAGAYGVGVWDDAARGRWPDYFDLQTAVMAMLFAWVITELAMPGLEKLPRAQPAFLAGSIGIGIVYAALAHAAPTFLSGLLQVPLAGLAMIRSTFEGLFFTLRAALLPAVVCGALAGALSGWLLSRSRRAA